MDTYLGHAFKNCSFTTFFCAIIIMCEFMRIIIYTKMIFRLISLVIGIKMTVVFSDYESIENSDTVKTVDMLTILVLSLIHI